nr:probable phospholipid-transporting ATPase 4 [Ipomoea batatas]
MTRGRIRARIRKSNLYTFAFNRYRAAKQEGPHQLGPGYSRIVHCNQPQVHEVEPLKYCSNYITTTKYNFLTFLPKAVFEQFRRVANLYFLLAAILSLTPVAPFSAISMIAPLVFVVGLSMAKEALEDWQRFLQDMSINLHKTCYHKGDGVFGHKPWMKILVGDIVKIEKNEFFPADLLLLSSSYEDGICYVETMNLDGETNLKAKRALEVTLPLEDNMTFKEFTATIKCEDPNPNLYTFVGNLEYAHQVYPLDPGQILLRGSKLRNTDYVYGVTIFTGHDSKVMQNSTKSPSKRSCIERKMDSIIYILFTVLVLISLISSVGFAVKTKFEMPEWWYLYPHDKNNVLYDTERPALSGIFHLITALILYGYLIPISLYVSIELVKVIQALFINSDMHMYDEETGTPAQARTSNLNEELGQVDTILSDKTGTLTCNQMDFLKCSIAGTAYGKRASDVELAAQKNLAMEPDSLDPESKPDGKVYGESEIELEAVITLKDEKDQKPAIKGIIFDRLATHGKRFLEATTKHLNDYGEAGLRTLVLAYKELHKEEYYAWNEEFTKAKTSIGANREAMLEQLSDMMERNLILVGATAVEDKLQSGVPQCIDKLAQAGLKIWVLTGDKMETAINIGFACSLLRQGMHQICVSTNMDGTANNSREALKESISMQIANGSEMVKLEKDPHAAFALIIDGKTLSYALEDDMKQKFLNLAVDCASVICCRVSPKQKALVTRLVKEGTGKTTLAIGDGANDVGMIQEADIGVGISGAEGMQAVMASDFAIAKFQFLERLLIVHGHWCYKRIAQMICYFFYKNIAFGLTLLYYEAFTAFSGQSIYDDWYMILFNVVLTSLPVISLGVFEQDVSSEICLQFPALYQQGPRNLFFDWFKIFSWIGNGFYNSFIIFFLNLIIFYDQAFRAGGQTADQTAVGTVMFTCVIWAVNCQIALAMSHFTLIQCFLIWGSIVSWYIFLFVYGLLSPIHSGNAFRILPEALAPAPIFWCTTLLVTIACNLPYLGHVAFQRCFSPMDHHIIQEMKYYRKDVRDRRMWGREKLKAKEKTKVGFSVAVDDKIRQIRALKGRLQKRYYKMDKHQEIP